MQFCCFHLKILHVFHSRMATNHFPEHCTESKCWGNYLQCIKEKTKANPKNILFPQTLMYSLTLQIYKLIQVIHVAHSCSDKPFSCPWPQNNTSHNAQITEARFKPAQGLSGSINPFIIARCPSKSTYLSQLWNTIISTALSRVKVPLHRRIRTLPCYVLHWNQSVPGMLVFKKMVHWNQMNGNDVKYFVLAFSGERGKHIKDFIFIPKTYATFS